VLRLSVISYSFRLPFPFCLYWVDTCSFPIEWKFFLIFNFIKHVRQNSDSIALILNTLQASASRPSNLIFHTHNEFFNRLFCEVLRPVSQNIEDQTSEVIV
jgi:hypothetical protein